MALESALNCNTITNFTSNSSSCAQPIPPPQGPMVNPYLEFDKFVFGSAIYIIIISFTTLVANGLLLVVFFFDPLKIFRNTTTYFLVGLAFVDILTAAIQEPMFATCFLMMYLGHPDTGAICSPLFEVGQYISLFAMNASFLIVLAFTVTQYIVVMSPLRYALSVTKTRVVICVLSIYLYAICFSLLSVMGVPTDIHQKCDIILHSIVMVYLTILFYILLYKAFKKKMAASENLREDNNIQNGGKDNRQTAVQRKFIIINFLLIAILFVSSQPSTILWFIHLYSNDDPNSPKVQIRFLMAENVLYLKFLLDPFVYAWRIPKYRQAPKIVLRCGREEPEAKSTFSDRVMARMSASRDTVITLNFKNITPD
ncbi:hypothetical protein OS493_032081 [Desmophyllum pertusum]|uniref:G-protein coupled receptors family 1 profile domain-containing protein n=1 Tax=Desmophyllum pertusum TaxID=174260 RepID=A0A9X0CJU8_9CNID|nr:hypothetical protein OS493_032081 [Desmophyllum pertusum]